MTSNSPSCSSRNSALADAYFRNIVESSAIAIITVDEHLKVLTYNPAAVSMFSAPMDLPAESSLSAIVPGDTCNDIEKILQESIHSGQPDSSNIRFRPSDGPARVLALDASPINDNSGATVGAIAFLRDISAPLKQEAEAAQKAKMHSLAQMAGTLAHHFNNILGGAVTCLDFALATDDHALQERTLGQTSAALGRATKLIDSLLAFAEGDHRHSDMCDITELLNSISAYMRPEMESQNVTLELKLESVPETIVPRAPMVTVIENVLHNAVDAIDDGGTATLSCFNDDGVVTISIEDDGSGIDPENLPRIFEPFFTTKTGGGLDFEHHPGLGLTVAHGILQELGYSIFVDSIPGKSTTVLIRIKPQSEQP